jgi:hypothetical protein
VVGTGGTLAEFPEGREGTYGSVNAGGGKYRVGAYTGVYVGGA